MNTVKTHRRIRATVAGDAENISKLICGLSEKYITGTLSLEGKRALLGSMSPAAIQKHLQSGYRYHVFETDGQLVGVVGVRDNSHLYHLFVADGYQRQGVASRLWKAAMGACVEQASPRVFTVNSSMNALGVYEKFGFVAMSERVEKNGVVFVPMKLTVTTQQ